MVCRLLFARWPTSSLGAFWSGGITNPLEVMERITYLLFIRRLDERTQNQRTRPHKVLRRLGTRLGLVCTFAYDERL